MASVRHHENTAKPGRAICGIRVAPGWVYPDSFDDCKRCAKIAPFGTDLTVSPMGTKLVEHKTPEQTCACGMMPGDQHHKRFCPAISEEGSKSVTSSLVHAFNHDPNAASSVGACGGQGWRGPVELVTCVPCVEILKAPVACGECDFRTDTIDVLRLHRKAGHGASDYELHAPVAAGQGQPCGCPSVGGHFQGCPVLAENDAQAVADAAAVPRCATCNRRYCDSQRCGYTSCGAPLLNTCAEYAAHLATHAQEVSATRILAKYGVDLHDWLASPELPDHAHAVAAAKIASLQLEVVEAEGWAHPYVKAYSIALDVVMEHFLPTH